MIVVVEGEEFDLDAESVGDRGDGLPCVRGDGAERSSSVRLGVRTERVASALRLGRV